ncbi:MAG: hypothetical protein M3419_10090 [Actinomycetota bacterium]|nr:hypothetical protein [Actinomycetota bacterium]
MGRTRTYDGAPSSLPLYAKAVLPAIWLLGSLPGIRHTGTGAPDLTLVRAGVRTDPAHLAGYAGVCGFGLTGTLPATYPHLAAFGLHLALMTDTAFPFAPMGVVHVANSITQYRALAVHETFDVRVHAAALRAHPRGRLIDLVTTATVGDETVWEELTTLLSRGRRDDEVADSVPLGDVDPPVGPVRWQLPGDAGRRYAAVSGDHNPIHLYGLTARAFGFPRQIAHGMWTKARCLAALQGRLPDAFTVQVAFRKPVLLPATVHAGVRDEHDCTVFGVVSACDGSPHLVGTVMPR